MWTASLRKGVFTRVSPALVETGGSLGSLIVSLAYLESLKPTRDPVLKDKDPEKQTFPLTSVSTHLYITCTGTQMHMCPRMHTSPHVDKWSPLLSSMYKTGLCSLSLCNCPGTLCQVKFQQTNLVQQNPYCRAC